MAYSADGSLADLWPPDFVDAVGEDIAADAQDLLFTDAKRLTPRAKLPQAYHGDFPAWIEDRGGREPGTLADRWEKLPIERTPDGFSAAVENVDPIASYVEHDTQPHMIFAKKAKALRFPDGPVFRYRPSVWHPGTQGQHMMRDSEMGLDARWEERAQRAIDIRSERANL
jgi:hypothetical protein